MNWASSRHLRLAYSLLHRAGNPLLLEYRKCDFTGRGGKTSGDRFQAQPRALDPLRSYTCSCFSASTRIFRERKGV